MSDTPRYYTNLTNELLEPFRTTMNFEVATDEICEHYTECIELLNNSSHTESQIFSTEYTISVADKPVNYTYNPIMLNLTLMLKPDSTFVFSIRLHHPNELEQNKLEISGLDTSIEQLVVVITTQLDETSTILDLLNDPISLYKDVKLMNSLNLSNSTNLDYLLATVKSSKLERRSAYE